MASPFPWHIRLRAVPRLSVAVALALVVFVLEPGTLTYRNRLLLSWDLGAAAYVCLAWLAILTANPELTRQRVQLFDQSAYVIFLVVLTAACVSMVGAGFLSGDIKQLSSAGKATRVALTAVAVFLSWALIHTVFTFHYAREYYGTADDAVPGGLAFPNCETPAYIDFAYFAFVVGMTAQVSDVAVTSTSMRRTTLAHGVMSFIFNIAVLAVSINVISAAI